MSIPINPSLLTQHGADAATLRRGSRRLVLVALLLAVALAAAIIVRQGLFRQTTEFSFIADSAQDIATGLPVRIAGLRVGSVAKVDLKETGKVTVVMEIADDKKGFVSHDARVELRKEGLVGSATLEIISGPDKTRLAAAQARLPFTRADGIAALATQFRDEFIPIIRDVKAITGALADPEKGLPGTLAHVRDSSQSLSTLLTSSNHQVSTIGNAATRVLGKTEEDLTHLGKTLEAANAQLPAMLERTRRMIEHAESITAEAAISVPPALRDGSAVAADVREIVSGAKQSWPIRNFVDTPAPATLKLDSSLRGETHRGKD